MESEREQQALEQARLIQNLKAPAVEPFDYRIRPTDVIEVSVFDYEKMNVAGRVGVDGRINFPPLGAVQVAGLTQREIETAIADKLRGAYLQNPNIIVTVKEAAFQNVTVLGEVKSPGQQAIWGETHLVDVLAKAGGVAPTAGNVAYLVRGSGARSLESGGEGSSKFQVSSSKLNEDDANGAVQLAAAVDVSSATLSTPVVLASTTPQPDPSGSQTATLASQAATSNPEPGKDIDHKERKNHKEIIPGDSGLASNLDLPSKAIPISLAGLFQRGEKDWDIPILPGDVITVPPAGSVYLTGPGIEKPGTYPLTFTPRTIREVIDEAGGLKWGAKRAIILARQNAQTGKTDYYKVNYKQTLKEAGYDGPMQSGDRLIVTNSGWRAPFDALRRGFLNATATFAVTPEANIGMGTNALFVK